jgi:bifunctional DNase/RNase
MTVMRVKALRQQPDGQQAVVVLEDVAARLGLAFFIPINEANRLARILGLTDCPCTPVYELVDDLVSPMGARTRAVLDGESDGIYATLALDRQGVPIVLRCHPADAIAVALRARVAIHATAAALAHACPLTVEGRDGEIARWLRGVRPDDFRPADAR